MKPFWQFLIALFASFSVAGVLGIFLQRHIINIFTDAFIRRLMKDPYPENIGEMINVFKKIGIQNVLEADLRGNKGGVLERPFGSPVHFSPWDQLLFNPVYLYRKPIVQSIPVDLNRVIGPNARRPLSIELPVMLGGMAFGMGPSFKAKIALAKGADKVNTAANTGAGPFLPEERKHTKRLIIQYNRGNWGKGEDVLRQADAIEIQLGYGALGSAPVTVEPEFISEEFREYLKLKPGEEVNLSATLENAQDRKSLKNLVEYLKKITNGVPVGVKIGATHHLEKELEIITSCEPDFLTIDGAEGGINFGPPILADDIGLPAMAALCRSVSFLKKHRLDKKISLIIAGGLSTPGQFLKAVALGADAVYIGTVAMIVLAHLQLTKVIPWEPPTELVFELGKHKDKLDIEEGAKNIANFLNSCKEEMILALRAMGKTSLAELSRADMCALTEEVAKLTGTDWALFPPGEKGGA